MSDARTQSEEELEPGTRVEVRSRFDQRWTGGFEVAGSCTQGYRVRRLSDGSVLPSEFAPDEVRRERRRRSMWWY